MQTCHLLEFFETKFRSIDHLLILGTYEFHATTSAPGAGGWPCRARGFFVGGGGGGGLDIGVFFGLQVECFHFNKDMFGLNI